VGIELKSVKELLDSVQTDQSKQSQEPQQTQILGGFLGRVGPCNGQYDVVKGEDSHKIDPKHAFHVLVRDSFSVRDNVIVVIEVGQIEIENHIQGKDRYENIAKNEGPIGRRFVKARICKGNLIRFKKDRHDRPKDTKAPPGLVARIPRQYDSHWFVLPCAIFLLVVFDFRTKPLKGLAAGAAFQLPPFIIGIILAIGATSISTNDRRPIARSPGRADGIGLSIVGNFLIQGRKVDGFFACTDGTDRRSHIGRRFCVPIIQAAVIAGSRHLSRAFFKNQESR